MLHCRDCRRCCGETEEWVYVVSPAETSSFRSVAVLLVQQNVCPEAESLLLTDFEKTWTKWCLSGRQWWCGKSKNKDWILCSTTCFETTERRDLFTASFKKRINVLMDTLSLFTAGPSLLSVQIHCGPAEGALQIQYQLDLLLPYWLFTNETNQYKWKRTLQSRAVLVGPPEKHSGNILDIFLTVDQQRWGWCLTPTLQQKQPAAAAQVKQHRDQNQRSSTLILRTLTNKCNVSLSFFGTWLFKVTSLILNDFSYSSVDQQSSAHLGSLSFALETENHHLVFKV